jgi:hypothetical protein
MIFEIIRLHLTFLASAAQAKQRSKTEAIA